MLVRSVSARCKLNANLQSQSQAVGPLLPQMLLALPGTAPGQPRPTSCLSAARSAAPAWSAAHACLRTAQEHSDGQVWQASLQVPGRAAAAMSRLAWVVLKGWRGLLAAVHVRTERDAPPAAAAGHRDAEGTAAGDTGAALPKDLPTT